MGDQDVRVLRENHRGVLLMRFFCSVKRHQALRGMRDQIRTRSNTSAGLGILDFSYEQFTRTRWVKEIIGTLEVRFAMSAEIIT